jgi:hypothetical protein
VSADEPATTTVASTSSFPPTTDTQTLNPSAVSNREAKKRALTAEGAYLESRLENASCLTEWGWYSPTSEEQSKVTGRTADTVYVNVTHPYFYATDTDEADAVSTARYAVGVDSTERLSGDDVSPC